MKSLGRQIMKKGYERIYARIDLDNILYNLRAMALTSMPENGYVAVLKADGYGHGAREIARLLEEESTVWGYAVATPEEGLSLRKHGILKPILLLADVPKDRYEEMILNDIRLPIFEENKARSLSETAKKLEKNAVIHLKLDTGMGRIGLTPDEKGLREAVKICGLEGITAEGLFTHLATADMEDTKDAKAQVSLFRGFKKALWEAGVKPPLCHYANSAATIGMENGDSALCRVGISLYGLYPSEVSEMHKTSLLPAMSLKSAVSYVKTVPCKTPIGYGGAFVTERESVIATVSAGYADGYPRSLSQKGEVLIHGKRCRIAGRICMDQFMVDVTELSKTCNVTEGDTVTLIGEDGNECITMEELGNISGRFNYELACDISKRVPRVFMKDGLEISSRDYFSE